MTIKAQKNFTIYAKDVVKQLMRISTGQFLAQAQKNQKLLKKIINGFIK